ncbi:helix-turn-helix domain-containing protein [Saccharopolyspora hirsuta]|uniref:Helix-turn-helix domain-containing protein n=2 Tax=Saccharopolyspora hirsuta TaxID=1837 RepID=A0A5M7BCD0_SACHI|nr:helix-turn-helix domain-containing protein [Saccharopolyspora hirsuta]
MYSVEQVAGLLGLHVRTVRGYIRSGRLNAVRIGKQYRIARADLEAFTGRAESAGPVGATSVEVSSIVQIDGVDRSAADRLGTLVLAGVNTARGASSPLRVQTVYDEERNRLKVVVLGGAGDTAEVLRLLEAVLEGGLHSGEVGNG